MKKITYGIVGAGWRAEFYLRIAAALPDRFAVSGVHVRNDDRAAALTAGGYGPLVCRTREALLARPADFLVCCVNAAGMLSAAAELAATGMPVLCETPAGVSSERLEREAAILPPGARVAFAEQFLRQPYFAAIRRILALGLLGDVHYLRLSAAHDYHGVSLARGLLGTGAAMPHTIRSFALTDPVRQTRGRAGDVEGRAVNACQTVAVLAFDGGKTALLDFSREQYFSPVRTGEVLLRGTRGEVHGDTLRYLAGDRALTLPLCRTEYGRGTNLDGFALDTITAGEHLLYRNPFPGARLSDEELAIADTLSRMGAYAAGTGEAPYTTEEARLDCRIACAAAENALPLS